MRGAQQQSVRALPFAVAALSLLLLVGAELLGRFGWVLWFLLPLVSVPLLEERKWGGFFLSGLAVLLLVFFLPVPHYSWFLYAVALLPLPFFRETVAKRFHKGWQSSVAVLLLTNGTLWLGVLLLYLVTEVALLTLLPPLQALGLLLLLEILFLLTDVLVQLFARFYHKKLRTRLFA